MTDYLPCWVVVGMRCLAGCVPGWAGGCLRMLVGLREQFGEWLAVRLTAMGLGGGVSCCRALRYNIVLMESTSPDLPSSRSPLLLVVSCSAFITLQHSLTEPRRVDIFCSSARALSYCIFPVVRLSSWTPASTEPTRQVSLRF